VGKTLGENELSPIEMSWRLPGTSGVEWFSSEGFSWDCPWCLGTTVIYQNSVG
jgi:hypothetical protein